MEFKLELRTTQYDGAQFEPDYYALVLIPKDEKDCGYYVSLNLDGKEDPMKIAEYVSKRAAFLIRHVQEHRDNGYDNPTCSMFRSSVPSVSAPATGV